MSDKTPAAPGVIVCQTPRLSIRHMTLDDAAFLVRQLNQPSFLLNIGDRGVRDVTGARDYITTRTFAQYRTLGYGMNVLELKPGGAPIGVCGLVRRDPLPHPDLGFALLEDFWGQGYAYEAAQAVMRHARETLGIDRLLAITTLDNDRSGRLLTKLGFRPEGHVRLTPDGAELRLYAAAASRGMTTIAHPAPPAAI